MKRALTLDGFLKRLRRTPRDWRLDQHGRLRRLSPSGNSYCPVSSLTKKTLHTVFPSEGADILGLRQSTCDRIVMAADLPSYLHPTADQCKLRARLLRACGLKPDGNPMKKGKR